MIEDEWLRVGAMTKYHPTIHRMIHHLTRS